MLLVVLGTMRAEIRRNDRGGIGSFKTAEFWFNNMTRYMDLLLETQRELAVKITQVGVMRMVVKITQVGVMRMVVEITQVGVARLVVEITQVGLSLIHI